MATGVQPRDEDTQITRTDLEAIQDAMKSKKFRDLLSEYCEEVRDPANQALYQKEMTQLEKERGYDVTFINPKGGYVIKTSVAGDRKAFINICSNENVGKPSCKVQEVDNQRGMNWQIPYTMIPPREDYDQKRERCVIYDVVFHPDTLRMAEVNKKFRELVNKTACEGLQSTYKIHLDNNNFRFPKSQYKGMTIPAVIRQEDPDFKGPPADEDVSHLSPEMIEKMYPQHSYPQPAKVPKEATKVPQKSSPTAPLKPNQTKPRMWKDKKEFTHETVNGYTIPKYAIKQQKNVDLQDFTYEKNSKQYTAIPSHIVVEINLPLLTSTKDCQLDVQEKSLSLTCEKPAKYKLAITLPYSVNDESGNAKFDKTKHLLIVTLPVIRETLKRSSSISSKTDSGVECEENSSSQSEDDQPTERLVQEISSTPTTSLASPTTKQIESNAADEVFFEPNCGYILPSYTHNVLDDIVAFTFHVKNTEPDSVMVKSDQNKIYIKFTTLGSGFVPIHYAALILFKDGTSFENATGEAWDNNVILQLEVTGEIPETFEIGLSENSLVSEGFDMSQVKKPSLDEKESNNLELSQNQESSPVVEVTNLGSETNIVVSSNNYDDDSDDTDETSPREKEIVWVDSGNCENGAKSILRKPINMMRSFSESSMGDVASSMDYISSDCIPEESSLKKTVRFSDVIAKQFYRHNSSIEGQKKKNQRKKSKKRSQDRRRSESEAEDDFTSSTEISKHKLKSVLKQRRDSGLADTSDVESECRSTPTGRDITRNGDEYPDTDVSEGSAPTSMLNICNNGNSDQSESTIWTSEDDASNKSKQGSDDKRKCDSDTKPYELKHNTDLYNPDRLNKGQYLEVAFKNDLIFDLDM